MADTNNLTKFLEDMANSIRTKTGTTEPIPAENFDTEIENIVTGTVVEKVVAEASDIIEEPNDVKIDTTPIGEQVVIPPNGIAEVLTDKALLAKNIGLTADKIVQGNIILDIEGTAEGGGSDTKDATAVPSDVLFPETFYSKGRKYTGSMTPEYSTSEPSRFKMHDLGYNVGGITNWSTICLGEYTFFYWRTGNICRVAAIKGNVLEAVSQDFTSSELYNTTSVANCLMTYDHWNDDEYVICPGHGWNTGGGTTYVYVRRIKYIPAKKTFEIIPGIAGFSSTDTGNNYGYCAFGTQSHPNHILVQWSYWTDRLNFSYCEINWTETSGSMRHVWAPGRIMGYSYGLWETGNGNHIACNNCFILLNDTKTSATYCSAAGKMFVSHNGEYGIMNNTLYKLTPGNTASAIYNSRVAIKSGLPSYNIIEFTDGDNYALLFNGVNTYVITFDDTGWVLVQTLNNSNYGTSTGSPFIGKSYIAIDSALNLSINYYDAKNKITSIERDNLKYVLADNTTTPNNSSEVLHGVPFIDNDGVHHGTMPNNGELHYEPSIEEQTIPLGYTSGGTILPVTSSIDSNIIGDNIKQGVEILGVTGTYAPEGGDATSDANVQAKYLLEGYSVVSDGKWIEGTMHNYGDTTMEYNNDVQEIPSGYYDNLVIPSVSASTLNGYDECEEALHAITYGYQKLYTELNYIESTGTQCIDTGIVPTNNTKFIIEYNPLDNDEGNVGINPSFGIHYGTKYKCFFGSTFDGSINKIANTKTKLMLDNTGLYVNDELSCAVSGNITSTHTIPLFAYITNDGEKYMSAGRIYSCKFYENGILVRDFMPVMDNSNSEVCLYDKVNKQFYRNSGSGNFVSGGVKV